MAPRLRGLGLRGRSLGLRLPARPPPRTPPQIDSASSDSGASSDAGASDAPTDSSAPALDAPSDGSCHPLTAADTDIYVDSRFAGMPQTGALACPLHTILEGITAANALGAPRTVHVAGSTPALVYAESSAVTVGAGITLLGAGALQTTLSASGTCMTGTCAVLVKAGGIVDGLTVVSPNGDGIWTASGNTAPSCATSRPAAPRATASWSWATSSSDQHLRQQQRRLRRRIALGGRGHVAHRGRREHVQLRPRQRRGFSGSAALDFEGGTANGNGQGIRIAGNPPASHSTTGLTAKGNTGPGAVVVYGGQTLKLRSSVLVGNTNTGMIYDYVNGSTLDLGTIADSGGNTFGGMSAADRNGTSGVMLCGAPLAQLAVGDSWASCPPSQVAVMCGGSASSTYADVLYESSVTGVNPVSGACGVGP